MTNGFRRMIRNTLFLFLALCLVILSVFPDYAQADTNATRIRVNQGGVSLRTQPNVDSEKIRGVHEDYELDVFQEQNGWYYVYYNGDWGWVIGSRVTVIGTTVSGNSNYSSSSSSSQNSSQNYNWNYNQGSDSFPYFSGFANAVAYPNQRLATRTGPSTDFDEPGTFSQSTQVRAMSKAYDTTNRIWWIQFQFVYQGNRYCAYTGLKRFDGLDINQLPEERAIGWCRFNSRGVEAFYAPSDDAAPGRNIPAGTVATIYAVVEGMDSDFIQVEFYDTSINQMRRAWVKEWWADEEWFY